MLFDKREIAIEIRFAENPGSVKAYADLTLTFSDGQLQLIGFAIIEHPGKDLYVAFPQNRGRNRYFPVVAAKGDLHEEIVNEVMRAYKHARERK
jgi:DNA-binding cell septation regulator SpoVG